MSPSHEGSFFGLFGPCARLPISARRGDVSTCVQASSVSNSPELAPLADLSGDDSSNCSGLRGRSIEQLALPEAEIGKHRVANRPREAILLK